MGGRGMRRSGGRRARAGAERRCGLWRADQSACCCMIWCVCACVVCVCIYVSMYMCMVYTHALKAPLCVLSSYTHLRTVHQPLNALTFAAARSTENGLQDRVAALTGRPAEEEGGCSGRGGGREGGEHHGLERGEGGVALDGF